MLWSWMRRFKLTEEVIIRVNERLVDLPQLGKTIKVSIEVNCLNASCPRPQILTIKAYQQLKPGEVMEIISDNISSVESLISLAVMLNARHLATKCDVVTWRIYLEKECDAIPMLNSM